MPRIVFSVVDLPDAFPPSRQTSSPCADVDRQPLQDADLPVVGVDVLELEQMTVRAHLLDIVFRPRYASTTFSFVATCSNEPSAILIPWSSATTRSEMPSTTCMSCSITRIV